MVKLHFFCFTVDIVMGGLVGTPLVIKYARIFFEEIRFMGKNLTYTGGN